MVDDHTLIRKGLNQILPELGGFVVADEASAASEALNQVSGSLMGKRFWMMAQLRCSLT